MLHTHDEFGTSAASAFAHIARKISVDLPADGGACIKGAQVKIKRTYVPADSPVDPSLQGLDHASPEFRRKVDLAARLIVILTIHESRFERISDIRWNLGDKVDVSLPAP